MERKHVRCSAQNIPQHDNIVGVIHSQCLGGVCVCVCGGGGGGGGGWMRRGRVEGKRGTK